MPSPSMHVYNILLAMSPPHVALDLFSGLLAAGLHSDRYAIPAVLQACAELSNPLLGAVLHGFSIHLGFLVKVVISGVLLDMYAKTTFLDDAVRVFNDMTERDVVMWNCMITAYARAGREEKALEIFRRAQVEAVNMESDLRSVPSALNACGKEGELMKGMGIHGRMVRRLAFDSDIPIGNVLIDMYVKCGHLDASQAFYAGMRERNVVSWSTLISCYGVHGMGEEALRVYEEMVSHGVKLNCITFMSLLSSCSHLGLVKPTAEHYACMVDLLGHAGAIEEAVGFMRKTPIEPCASVWGALLSTCTMHNNVDIGEIVAYRLFELEEGSASNYVTLYGIYDAVGVGYISNFPINLIHKKNTAATIM